MNVVLASNNRGKLAELNQLLRPLGFNLRAQSELNIPEADETASTFVENALLKARHAAASAGMPAIADDSGIVVDALGGAPGIRSARYAGDEADAHANNAKLIEALQGVTNRRASFYCALVYLRHPKDPMPLIMTAAWSGQIVDIPRGNQGFGYDPHFQVDGSSLTAAQLDPEMKNRISHRGRAAAALVEGLRELLPNLRSDAPV
jgi:XTP/dITP diphosphohydrolase